MTDRVSSKTAARIIGVIPQYLHQEMKAGRIDIGYVVGGGKVKNYIIMRSKLEKFIGRELTEEELNEE